ncbi:hypothetical protein [Sorangium sp. So ce388]|uniref:hypothetical protein n=1 Tax=Sorangium sp. So ce388 TaxID=3133309 RepID=UPI003F5B43C1
MDAGRELSFASVGAGALPEAGVGAPVSTAEAARLACARERTLRHNEEILALLEQRLAGLGELDAGRQAAVSFGAVRRGEPAGESAGPGGAALHSDNTVDNMMDEHLWTRMLDGLAGAVTPQLRIDTPINGVLIGATRASWTGDIHTMWAAGALADERRLHLANVRHTLAERLAMARFFAILVAGASSLALRLALPGGILSALPAAWRFVRSVLAEYRALKGSRSAAREGAPARA